MQCTRSYHFSTAKNELMYVGQHDENYLTFRTHLLSKPLPNQYTTRAYTSSTRTTRGWTLCLEFMAVVIQPIRLTASNNHKIDRIEKLTGISTAFSSPNYTWDRCDAQYRHGYPTSDDKASCSICSSPSTSLFRSNGFEIPVMTRLSKGFGPRARSIELRAN